MYDGWRISRWETPAVDATRLLMVSLVDAEQELVLLLESFRESGRPRWRVRFRRYYAYRNIDESFRNELWRWLDESGQRVGFTFTVEESPRLASWSTEHLHDLVPQIRHFVIATEEDVVEVLADEDPTWELADPAAVGAALPGKATHLYLGEDDEAIEQLAEDLERRQRDDQETS